MTNRCFFAGKMAREDHNRASGEMEVCNIEVKLTRFSHFYGAVMLNLHQK